MKLCVLLMFHLLGDFILQSSRMAEEKQKPGKTGRRALARHMLLYLLTSLLSVLWWGQWWEILLMAGFLGVSHAVVDLLCVRLRRAFPGKRFFLFLSDQAVHGILLVGASRMLGGLNRAGSMMRDMLPGDWGPQERFQVMLGIVLVLLCTAPAAVLVKEVFSLISASVPEEKRLEPAGQVDIYRSGYVIGVCERLIILVLGVAGQFGAVGFVLAAKSLARFKLLNDDKDFAERYLVGTLASALVAIVGVLIWNQLT